MFETLVSRTLEALHRRILPEGGWAHRPEGVYRPDATAWGILGLVAREAEARLLKRARDRLAGEQLPDGRVSLAPDYPAASWPTPLAILAWEGSPAHRGAQSRAVDFLLRAAGESWPKRADSPFGHDSRLIGWPWILGTHSWVEPTALAMLALRVAGGGEHPRVGEARRLLLDRQLAAGGWNYGNTTVFGRHLLPMPESTGIVLNALGGQVSRDQVAISLGYLKKAVVGQRTPRSLASCLLGLGAWGERPSPATAWIGESLSRQDRYGDYDTTSLGMLLVALRVSGGLETLFGGNSRS